MSRQPSPCLRTDLADRVLTVTLDRPQASNALSVELLEALARALRLAAASDAVRCVVLTGAGASFCAGGDIRGGEFLPQGDQTVEERIAWFQAIQRETVGLLHTLSKPTLAVVNGPAAGAGLSLALACDLRIMASSAFMLTAFATVGLSGDMGASYFLTQLVGAGRARELMLLPDRLSAADAVRVGLANWSCDPPLLAEMAIAVALRLAAGPPDAFRRMKENLRNAVSGDFDDCLDQEARHQMETMMSADHQEGIAAFFERRSPAFGKA